MSQILLTKQPFLRKSLGNIEVSILESEKVSCCLFDSVTLSGLHVCEFMWALCVGEFRLK